MNKIKITDEEIEMNGKIYVPKDSVSKKAESKDGMDYVLIRTDSAGVHCGYLKKQDGKLVILLESIRLWRWYGASACSQLAMEGVSNHKDSKFEMASSQVTFTEAIETHIMTEKAELSIKSVAPWKE